MPETGGWTPFPSEGLVDTVWYVPISMWGAGLLFAAVAIFWARPITFGVVVDKLLRYLFVFPLGLQGLWAFVGHVFFPDETASTIGWAASPFQYEVGLANLGIALASFYAAFSGFQARAAAAVAAACFSVGAGIGHINDIAQEANFAPGNAGPIMFTDFLTPIVILVLLIVQPQHPRAAPTSLAGELERARLEVEQTVARGR
jgi:hypothetical protein